MQDVSTYSSALAHITGPSTVQIIKTGNVTQLMRLGECSRVVEDKTKLHKRVAKSLENGEL